MNKLPIIASMPHAGSEVPEHLKERFLLSAEQVRLDGDDGAAEAYAELLDRAEVSIRAPLARAVLDINRRPDDRRLDGIVKSVSIFHEPVWSTPLTDEEIADLVASYHEPYHRVLTEAPKHLRVGIDCHTMLDEAPPIEGKKAGTKRPLVCLSTAHAPGTPAEDGGTMPAAWEAQLLLELRNAFGPDVLLNQPFQGGHIIRSHAKERPWALIELSRETSMSWSEKGKRVLAAIEAFVAWLPPT